MPIGMNHLTRDQVTQQKLSGPEDLIEGSQQYLTFLMAGEEYGVDILAVQEIRGWESVTPIPNTADFVKGVINLRGLIVPIIDLRQKFGVTDLEYGPLTVVIVMKVIIDDQERVMGMVVDAVSDVFSVNPDEIRPAPSLGDHVDIAYLEGLVTVNSTMVILLNISEVIADDRTHAMDTSGLKMALNSD